MEIVRIFGGFLTPLIAVITTYIAIQQYRTNKLVAAHQLQIATKKLNFDLYEKRFRIFQETKDFILRIAKEGKIDILEVHDFNININEAKFLFSVDIVQFLQELQKRVLNYSHLTEEINNHNLFPVHSAEYAEKVREWAELSKWFTCEYEHVEDRFLAYLDFKNL